MSSSFWRAWACTGPQQTEQSRRGNQAGRQGHALSWVNTIDSSKQRHGASLLTRPIRGAQPDARVGRCSAEGAGGGRSGGAGSSAKGQLASRKGGVGDGDVAIDGEVAE